VPDEEDILRQNMNVVVKKLVKFSVDAVVVFGLLFWSVPISLLQGLANWDNLETLFNLPRINPWLKPLVEYLPALATLLLLLGVPELFHWLAARVEQRRCLSMVESSAGDRYYYFYLATLYYTVLSGSIWGVLNDAVNNPKEFLRYYARVLPGVAVYFVTVVLGKVAALGSFLVSARVPSVRRWLYGEHFIFPFYRVLPDISFVFTVMMVYAIIAPATSWAVLAYFIVARSIYSRAFSSHLATRPAVAGRLGMRCFLRYTFAIELGALLVLGNVLLNNNSILLMICICPLPAFVHAFQQRLRSRLRRAENLPLEVANALDGPRL
jgi:hypothetical protein